MSVVITDLNASGVALQTSFSDPMHGAAGPLGIGGTNWAQGVIYFTPAVTPLGLGFFSLNGTAGVATFGGTANPNTQWIAYAIPTNIIQAVQGKTQFSQVTFRSCTGALGNAFGPVVSFRPSAMPIGYWFRWDFNVPLLRLQRFQINGNGAPGTSLNAADVIATMNGNVVNSGDVMRINVDESNPAAPVITCFINGVQKGQFTDNVSPITNVGVPGLWCQMHDNTFTFDNFSAGIGL